MFSFLKPTAPKAIVESSKILNLYYRYRFQSLLGVFIGYAAYYIVRNNFALSTHFLSDIFHMSKTEIGLLSSAMLIAYGLSKGFMSSLADKASPGKFMAFGLFCCAIINMFMSFADSVTFFLILVILNGLFQGFGVGPSFITIAKWYPKQERGRYGAIWNISHNLGGGIVAPIVAAALYFTTTEHWQLGSYGVPAVIAIIVALLILKLIKESPEREGLPPTSEIIADTVHQAHRKSEAPHMNTRQIFITYVLKNKHAWYVSLVDTFVYMIRFGILTWLPIYLLQVKGFSKSEMSVAFLFFEWAAIPSTIFAGYISDKFFKGYRMPPAIMAVTIIFFCIFGYWQSENLFWVTFFAAVIGCLIYIPQFLASVQTMDIVPPFAVGSAVGLRGFMSYIVGANFGTTLFGILADRWGWNAGFYLLFAACILCVTFCILAHFGAKELDKKEAMKLRETETNA
ncbi:MULTISPECIES: phosphoglycerate transporter PgtP [Bacillota]|uniref:phosphoglycerate transporter PgtP n=1 Tax=Bacillota TaxID=1239 RepID=UPI0023EFA623|nr:MULTISPECIES: MFS transporter [Bacillota]MCI6407705.1 MFS transporter [Veillonella caviae]MDY4128765.1 MFS transporter [Peptostreptococcus porci]MDY6225763.1 MFS transporter [Veillonella caviae]